MTFQKYLKLNIWLALLFICLIYVLALIIEFNFLFTDDFYKNVLSTFSTEKISNYISQERESEWVNFLIVPIITIVPALLITFWTYISLYIVNIKIGLFHLFDKSLKAQIIFAFNYIITVLLKTGNVIEQDMNTINNNYLYQSILAFFNTESVHPLLRYPLQCVNITEVIFVLFLTYSLKDILQMKFLKALKFTSLIYLSGLLIWIVFSIFLVILS